MICEECGGKGYIEYPYMFQGGVWYGIRPCKKCNDVDAYTKALQAKLRVPLPDSPEYAEYIKQKFGAKMVNVPIYNQEEMVKEAQSSGELVSVDFVRKTII